ncbi:hypothetical protein OC834_001733 [Tilletia horrida]|uniref:Lipase B n=1 Tax=Tilletia horrida TaxID=155126 RepID=A0AAN6JNL5_9BASI|nr:hypothetical protein OC834_001733 [Tilletia horrida]KAK0540926.1 hypothetical protein OC842_000237 [Tilletia horrida]KAK0542511.1 hypothetical protein OC844_007777 [Tilletia horrida]
MRFSIGLLAFALLGASQAATVPIPAPPTSDPALVTPQATLDANIQCPGLSGGYAAAKNPILLVPGTGNTGSESFDSNYVILTRNLGYQPCYISPPPFMLNDSQINAEYVVNAVSRLNAASGKKIPVLGWSQGNLIIQWALTFFPSTVGKVDRFVSFAGDFRGTVLAYLLDAQPLGIAPSIWQQSTLSAYLTALRNAGGLTAKVPTTSIYSVTDEIVQPQIGGPAIESSYLFGSLATNVKVQDYCPLLLVEHSQELFNAFTYAVAKAALQSPTGKAEAGSFTSASCSLGFPPGLGLGDQLVAPTIIVQAATHIIAGPRVPCEPPLLPYAAKYYPFTTQACNPLSQVVDGFVPQTPEQFNTYEALIVYILTHNLQNTLGTGSNSTSP